jgi:RNA polymerase primary sigma factor
MSLGAITRQNACGEVPQVASHLSENHPSSEGFFLDDDVHALWARELLSTPLPNRNDAKASKSPRGLPAFLAHLWTVPLLSAEQERDCFRRLNYAKYMASTTQTLARSCIGCAAMLEEGKRYVELAHQNRNLLIESNLRLVVSIARKYASYGSDDFEELVCVGNATLVHTVDLFDYRRGNRFSTYAYEAIQCSMFSEHRKKTRFKENQIAGGSEVVELVVRDAAECDIAELEAAEAREQVIRLMETLDERDRIIVMARFGINRKQKGVSFHVIAKEIGLSTTRTVQLFHRSIQKMRSMIGKQDTLNGRSVRRFAT